MAILDINPRYRDFLVRHGLADVERLQAVPATVVCGHPDRHVLQGTLGPETEKIPVYIKRQHRLGWGERIGNLLAGFGWISQSRREARLLDHARIAGVAAPDWIAAGEDDQGRAFLIVRAIPEAQALPAFLRGELGQRAILRRRLARVLGQALAHMHDAGFGHNDLYAKHVLVQAAGLAVFFLDWQRARPHSEVRWPRRWCDLADLDATLADHLAGPRDRLACLRAYLHASLPIRPPREFRHRAVRMIHAYSQKLLRQRRIHEQRQTPLAIGTQRLIWLDEERLCVTPEFRQVFADKVPEWLLAPADEDRPVSVPGSARATLIRRSSEEISRWLWSRLRRRQLTSPEVRQAALLFRLQRYGVQTPRLLAFGQRHPLPWQTESFLLTDVPQAAGLVDGLRELGDRPLWTAEHKRRWRLVRAAADLVRRTHDASCYGIGTVCQLGVRSGPTVILEDITGLAIERGSGQRRALRDLRRLYHSLPEGLASRTDLLRFLLAYLEEPEVTAKVRSLLPRIMLERRAGTAREARPAV